MTVERTKEEVIIRLSATVDTDDLQDFLNYARYKEIAAGYKTGQQEVDKLAEEINSNWWSENRNKLID